MGSREVDKMQRAKRRLAAVTFLTNISLDGSYKDTGWCQEHARAGLLQLEGGGSTMAPLLETCYVEGTGGKFGDDEDSNHRNGSGRNGLAFSNGNAISYHHRGGKLYRDNSDSGDSNYGSRTSLNVLEGVVVHTTPAKEPVGILTTSKLCGSSAEKENTAPGTAMGDILQSGRKRANTSDLGNLAKGKRAESIGGGDPETVSYGQTAKHAHFSSAESIENVFAGIQMRFHKPSATPSIGAGDTSTTSTSSTSAPPPPPVKGEVKFFNIRENPNSLPAIRNERLVIMVGKRTPCVVFSAIPYKKSSRFARVQDRVQEGLKRTRNTSGSRPLSSLSEPDPLEQLLHEGDMELSYGHLLNPSIHGPGDPTLMESLSKKLAIETGYSHVLVPGDTFEFPQPPSQTYKSHAYVSRCMTHDGILKSNPTSTTTNGSNGTPEVLLGAIKSDDANGPPPTLNNPAGLVYNPTLLDDPELRAGKHRTLMTFPSYVTSVIDYCKAADLKKELNDKFRDRFPHIQLTLSKMRSLKREMRRVAKSECNVDLLTVAQAYVYFEKLILGSFVTKFNRKYCAGACLLLSAKLNDIKGDSLHLLLEKIETTFRVNRKDLLCFEFAVLVALEFALLLPAWEVAPHYQRLMYDT